MGREGRIHRQGVGKGGNEGARRGGEGKGGVGEERDWLKGVEEEGWEE